MQREQSRSDAAWRRWGPRDPLVRAMVANWAFGMAIGVLCAALTLAVDFFGVRSLLWRSDARLIGVAMLCAAFAFTFGGVVCAAAVMGFEADETSRGGAERRAREIDASAACDPRRGAAPPPRTPLKSDERGRGPSARARATSTTPAVFLSR